MKSIPDQREANLVLALRYYLGPRITQPNRITKSAGGGGHPLFRPRQRNGSAPTRPPPPARNQHGRMRLTCPASETPTNFQATKELTPKPSRSRTTTWARQWSRLTGDTGETEESGRGETIGVRRMSRQSEATRPSERPSSYLRASAGAMAALAFSPH